jgi:FMN phosphatase YigB (HAD superfamily)
MRALVTDLDNTLYDWMTFFGIAFGAMVDELARLLDAERPALLSQFQEVHRRYGSTETPWAALELPAARAKFPSLSPTELATRLQPAFDAFTSARREHLRLYPGVRETLAALADAGVLVIGHTEAPVVNAYHRLALLGIAPSFTRLYALEGRMIEHPFPARPHSVPPAPAALIRGLPASERKPNPAVLLDICRREELMPCECAYVGDSLVRDVAMAKQASIQAIWARYGTRYDARSWDLVAAVTHWTSADVEREARLQESFGRVDPDRTIEAFSEILERGASSRA